MRAEVSVIVAWGPGRDITDTLDSLRHAARIFDGAVEIVLVCDRPDGGASCTADHPVRKVQTGGGAGSALARLRGIEAAGGSILLFTDDDTLVPNGWIVDTVAAVRRYGTCTGAIHRRDDGFWARCDERIDAYRVAARDSAGAAKFVSFPNLGLRRELLPTPPFEPSTDNLADDSELACRLRLSGVPIHSDPAIAVSASYPINYWEFLRRKIRHGRGLGQLRARLGRAAWHRLELGSVPLLFWRWIRLSGEITAGGSMRERALGLLANLAYCTALTMTMCTAYRRHRSAGTAASHRRR